MASSPARALSDYGLSPTENRIASMLFQGASNQTIATSLFVSESTVKHHITSIYRKLKVKNRLAFIGFIRSNRMLI